MSTRAILSLALATAAAAAQAQAPAVQRYLIEREIPGASRMSADELRGGAAKSGFPATRITPIAAVIDPTTASRP
jgi:hypothetical protein